MKNKRTYEELVAENAILQNKLKEFKKQGENLFKAEEKAEESEDKFRALTEQAVEGISVADMDGNYVFVNFLNGCKCNIFYR